MAYRYLHRISVSFLAISCLLALNQTFAQCPNDNPFWFNGLQPPCGTDGSIAIGGGTFATFNVDAGMTYTFTTCNSIYNTILTGYDAGGNQLFFNDDNGPDCAATQASVQWTANLTGTIRVLVDSSFCTTYSATSAILRYRQEISISSSNASLCGGETRALTGNPPGGTFSGTGVSGNTFTAPNQNATIPITYTFGACSINQNIQVNQNPLVTIISQDGSTFCTGDSARLIANGLAGSGTITIYQWKRNGTPVGANNPNFSATQAGSYTVEITNSNGCVAESPAFVLSELQPPNVSFTGLASDYCITDAGVILSGSPVGGAFSGSGIGGNNFIPFLAGMGVHPITYTYTAPNGCSRAQTQTTVVTDVPIISFTIPPFLCDGDTAVELMATPAGGTYSGVGVTGNFFDPVDAGVGGPYIITYTFTDTIGCGNTATTNRSVSVTTPPTVSMIGLATEYCANATDAMLTGIPAGGTFSGSGVTANSFVPAVAGAGAHTVTYSYTDNNGCSAAQSTSTLVNALPIVELTGLDAVYCEDDAVALMTGTPSGGTYNGVGLIANAFNPAGAGAGGPYDITYSFTDNNNCTGADTLQVSVNAIPTVTISGLDPIYCVYIPDVPLTLSPAGGQLLGTGVSGSSFNPNAAGVGTHVLVYSYADNAGCANSTQEIVMVDACVGIEQINSISFAFHPNPTTGKIVVTLSGISSQAFLRVYTLQGKQLLEHPAINGTTELNLAEFSKGIYLLRLISNKETLTRKVILE
ncbi:MAG: T9SS type A sorting domain-containing protein [Chitinophagales bacterium]|nr:T9SS type A sorting domain-containing protein [Chitinophagales bacterium]